MAYDLTPKQRDAMHQQLRRDPVLRPLVDEFELPEHRVQLGKIYSALLRAIIGQQVSVAAATSIYRRFLALYGLEADGLNASIDPQVLAEAEVEHLRTAGLSRSKATYVIALAEYFAARPTAEADMRALDDEAVIAELVSIKGVGRWTAEMMLMFALGRMDLLPLDDLAISQTIVELYGLEESGRALKAKQREVAEAWRPYRSVACLYLYAWRHEQRSKKPGSKLDAAIG